MKPEHRKPKPEWLRRRFSTKSSVTEVNDLLLDLNLHTVCQEAHCPNQSECFGNHTATFMLLGDHCSRNCTFCAVTHGVSEPPDPEEPKRVAEAVSRLGLKYVVLTSVTRDDLADGGASHFAATIKTIRSFASDILVEVLVPDFQGSAQSLATVLASQPAVLNHNLETVSRLYPAVRPQADYQRSLRLLKEVKRLHPEAATKSGFMVGLGEKQEEVSRLLRDLRKANCDLVTIGQYLRPSRDHHPVVDYIHPELFKAYQQEAETLGFSGVASGPYVRSSYQAEKLYRKARGMD
ncbi:MAG: lipoyl synthase [Deltaproteobacteria bacterium]|nr:MAG: lipoyl synthase [Deltaproteobacteria bacterium]